MSQQSTRSEVSVRTGDDRRTLTTTSQQQQQRKQQNKSRRSRSPKRSRLQYITDNNSNIVVSAPNPNGYKRSIPFSSDRLVPCFNDNCNQPTNEHVHKCVVCNSAWHLQCSGLDEDEMEVTLIGGEFKCKECRNGIRNNSIVRNNINNINNIWKTYEVSNINLNNNNNINNNSNDNSKMDLNDGDLECDAKNCKEKSDNMGFNCKVCDKDFHPICIGVNNQHWEYYRDLGCRLQNNTEFICINCDLDKNKLFIMDLKIELDRLNVKKNEESINNFNKDIINNNNNNQLSQESNQSVLSSQWSQSIQCNIPFTNVSGHGNNCSSVPSLEIIPAGLGGAKSGHENSNNNGNNNNNNNKNNNKLDKKCKNCKRFINFANNFDYLLFEFDINKLCIECNSKKEFEYTCIHSNCSGKEEYFTNVNKLLDHIHARHGEVNEWINIFKIRKCIEYGCLNRIIGSEGNNNSEICRKHKYLKRIHDNKMDDLDTGYEYGDEKIEHFINCEQCETGIKIINKRLLLLSSFRKHNLCDMCIYKQPKPSSYVCIHSNCKDKDIEYNNLNKLFNHILENHLEEEEWLKLFNISRCSISNCNLKALKKAGVCAKHYIQGINE